MNVCTLTWYRGNNYGSVLQAYALQQVLESMGHSCDILAYSPAKLDAWKLKIRNRNVGATIAYKANELMMRLKPQEADRSVSSYMRFEEFRKEHLKLSARCSLRQELEQMNQQYDAFFCGSDQIWNPYCYDPAYFLSFVSDTRKKIAYAPSFGVATLPQRCLQDIHRQLKRFQHLSVREKRGAEIIQNLTGQQAQVVADPTLLLPVSAWDTLANSGTVQESKPYLLCYFLSKRPYYDAVVQGIAKQFGLAVRKLPMIAADYGKKETIQQPVGPVEWLSLVRGAAFVLTDSFHCTLFSMQFHTPFYTLQRFTDTDERGQNSRVTGLLEEAGMEDRFLKEPQTHYTTLDDQKLTDANSRLQPLIQNSLTYLRSSLCTCERKQP